MKKLLFILLLTIPFIGFGQGWEKTFSNNFYDVGMSVQQTTDGGYIVGGWTFDTTGSIGIPGNVGYQVYLVKTDSNGDSLWTKKFGGDNPDQGYSVQQTTDGGYVICGYTYSYGIGTKSIWLIKTDGNGDSLWTRTYSGGQDNHGWSVQQTIDGGYIISGWTSHLSIGVYSDFYLIKTDSNGDSLWTKKYGGSGYDMSYSVQQTTDSGYVICGWTSSMGSYDDVWLIKTDSQGDSLWSKTYGWISSFERGEMVEQTTDGGYIICGWTTLDVVSGNDDILLIKTDSNGDSLWIKTFGGINIERGYSVQQTNDGGYIITGKTNSFGNGSDDVWLIKTDGNGDSLWTRTYGGSKRDEGMSVKQTTDGGYIITGFSKSFGTPGEVVYLIKTDGNGNITSTFNIPTPSSNRKLEKVVDMLGREIKSQNNTPFIEIYDDGSTEKKLIIEK